MDKEARVEEGAKPEENASDGLSPSSVSDSGGKPEHYEFNEQTHYVPKSTIITVSLPRFGLLTSY